MTDMIVSGAEFSAANGTYVETGTYDGRPKYIHESNADYVVLYLGIYDEVNFLLYLRRRCRHPRLCSSWTDGFAWVPSALTVTAGSSQNLTLTCAAGSYSLGTNVTLTHSGITKP